MSAPSKSRHSFNLYLLTGGIAAAVNFGSRFLFSRWMPFEVAIIAAFGLGLLTGFLLMRRYAFAPSQQSLGKQILGYLVVNAMAVLQTLAVSSLLARWLLPELDAPGNHAAIAHAVGVIVPALTSYFWHQKLSFR